MQRLATTTKAADWLRVGHLASQRAAITALHPVTAIDSPRATAPCGPKGVNSISTGTRPRATTMANTMMRVNPCRLWTARYSDSH